MALTFLKIQSGIHQSLGHSKTIHSGKTLCFGQQPGKMRALLDYLSGFSPNIHSDAFRWDDPLPERDRLNRLGNRIAAAG